MKRTWSPSKQLEIAEREAHVMLKRIVMDGSTLVTFRAGLDVQHIVCGYESCILTIKHLPQNVQQSEVETLFTQLGVNRNLFYVITMRQIDNEVQAKVLSDSEVGQAIAACCTGMEFRDGHCLDIAVDNFAPPSKRNINVLTVTWTLPSFTMVAQYSTSDAALDALKRLNNSVFSHRRIQAEWYRAPEDFSAGHSSPSIPSIKISGLPLNVTTADVEKYCGAYSAWILAILPGYDLTQIMERIKGSERYEVNLPNPQTIRSTAVIRFQFRTWDEAKAAQNSLKGWKLSPDHPPLHSWLPMPIQYITIIPTPQYHAQKRLWDSMPIETDNDTTAFIRVINDGKEKTIILILGKNKKAVGQLKVRVDVLLAGEALDWRLWHRSFMSVPGRYSLERINTQTKAFVRVDLASKQLKLYADGDIKQTVIDLITAETARLEKLGWSISIPPSMAEFFMCRGLPTLKEELGEDAAMLILHPTAQLVIRGGEEARRKVDRLIEESLYGIECEACDGENDTCPICFVNVSSPVLLSCGHVYCADCLRHFLSSAAERKMFPLACLGNETACRAPVALPVIRRFLLQQQFDQLVGAAVKAYIEKQPDKFRYCATPGCIQAYRCREDNKSLACPSCFTAVCTSCHKEGHEGMTCREKEIMDNPEEQDRLNEEWAQNVGAKRCPSCQIWIQKTEGCNHMACFCGAHICWNCLKTFSRAQDVYKHMRAAHGGMHGNGVRPVRPRARPRNAAPRGLANREGRRRRRTRVEPGHRDDLDIGRGRNGQFQDQAGRQLPPPAIELQPQILQWQLQLVHPGPG